MELEEINRDVDSVLKSLRRIQNTLKKECVFISLDREKFKDKSEYMMNVFKESIRNNSKTVRIFFGSDEFKIKGKYFKTNDKVISYYQKNFYYSMDVPITEESEQFFRSFDSSFVNNLPNDTKVRLYTTPEMNYLTFTKGDLIDYKGMNWELMNRLNIIQPYFKCKETIKNYEN